MGRVLKVGQQCCELGAQSMAGCMAIHPLGSACQTEDDSNSLPFRTPALTAGGRHIDPRSRAHWKHCTLRTPGLAGYRHRCAITQSGRPAFNDLRGFVGTLLQPRLWNPNPAATFTAVINFHSLLQTFCKFCRRAEFGLVDPTQGPPMETGQVSRSGPLV